MTIARKIAGTWVLWDGAPFQHPQHPEWGARWQPTGDIENLWSPTELSNAGLVKVTVVGDVAVDPTTQVKTGPVYTQDAASMTATYTVRSKTAPELDADRDTQVSSLNAALFLIAFNHENRIRTLEARMQVTMIQFKAAIKALLP